MTRAACLAACAAMLAACSGTTSPVPSSSAGYLRRGCPVFDPADFHPCWLAANVNAVGTAVRGGTLKLEGDEDVDAYLDPQGEYGAVSGIVERAYTRQLVSYPLSTNLMMAESTIVPDAATAMPSVSTDELTYTFHIKPGVMWNTTPPRQVTSQDFMRGLRAQLRPQP